MQIKKKLPIMFNLLICVSLVGLAIITYLYLSHMAIKKSEQMINQLVRSEGRALVSLIEGEAYQVQYLANDERVRSYLTLDGDEHGQEENAQYLKNISMVEENYKILLLTQEGKIIGGSKEVIPLDIVDSGRVFSYVPSEKAIYITAPVKDESDKGIGFVCKVITSDAICKFIDTIQVEQTGYAFVTDEESYVIAHPDESQESVLLDCTPLRESIEQSKEKGERQGWDTYTYNGTKKYAFYYMLEDTNWTLCITQAVYEMQYQAFVGSLLIVVAMVILIFLVSGISRGLTYRITKPIDLLIETMDGVAKGDFEKRCSYKGNDEFGVLAESYNQMIEQLGESHYNINEVCEELVMTKARLEYNYAALKEIKEALVLSEERYKTTLDAIEEVIWEYYVEDEKFFATENLSRIVGVVIENENVSELMQHLMDEKSRFNFIRMIQRCIKEKISDFTYEMPIYQNGKKSWFLCKGHILLDEKDQVKKIIGILMDITDNKHNEERVRKLTFFDELTGCFNKATFIESLEAWVSSDIVIKDGALLFVDLDDLKKVNDTLGHDLGDQVLHYVGKMLRENLPQDTFVGRFGGDEFVIFKTKVESVEEVHELIYMVLNMFQNKVEIEENKLHLTCSVGIALYPGDGQDSARLLKNADTAMFKAKENGKNGYSFYTPAMTQTLDRKLMIEEALREAVSKDSFYLLYQPVVESITGRMVGAEALIRLEDSELGFISPGEFIPIAEETDLIIETGSWVLEKALDTLSEYHQKGYTDFTININVSSIQIREKTFLSKLKYAIKKAGVSTRHIKLEVTESVLMENIEESIQLFKEVKAMGIQIALDDFGTGYSSLNYLRSIPLDVLKIDKSFVDEITTSKVLSEIVDSIINMAHALNIFVVAEGVETYMQFEVLRKKGCDFIQGYYFSKPIDKELLEEYLKMGYKEKLG